MRINDIAKLNLKRSGKSSIPCRVEIVGVQDDTKVGIRGIREGMVKVRIVESEEFYTEVKGLTTY